MKVDGCNFNPSTEAAVGARLQPLMSVRVTTAERN